MPPKEPAPVPFPWRTRIVGEADVDPASILDQPDNWRLHPRLQQRALSGVLDEVGWVQPVVVNRRTRRLLDGHLRAFLARKRGEATIPVVYVDLDEGEEAKILATLDPIAAMARTDADALRRTLASVTTEDHAVERLLERVAASGHLVRDQDGATDPDALPVGPTTRAHPGDCWLLGDHRLVCGDATDPAVVSALMGEERAALIATDPPYFVDYDGRNHPGAGRRTEAPPSDWDRDPGDEAATEFYAAFLRAALEIASPGVAVYQWHAERRRSQVERAWSAVGLHPHQAIVWVKEQAVPGHSHYPWRHEPALYGWRAGEPPPRPLPGESTVWPVAEAEPRTGHPTQKPVELFAKAIRAHTMPGDVVYEPFAGRGSQIIAAEQLGRRCHAVELDPVSVDLAVSRWEAFTAREAEVIRA